MPNVFCGVATLAVAGIFYIWRSYHDVIDQKRRILRERVTYMLWMMAKDVAE
jgi:hypothetical protein